MELVELIRGAQEAMDRGDYAFAAAACSHALATYPSCFTAHRMLAEAYLEQGRIEAAIEHFERTLAVDPLNVLAQLGLGVAAEEKREMSAAYAAYLHAWEINPALDQVRDELVRLRGLLGSDDRLHPTRAGLAGIYARGGQFGRAAAEWRAVLMVDRENKQARTSLAEILWRSGDDAPAAAMCHEALREFPENARALGMLAEIEQRRGSSAVTELIGRYQVVDPLAEIATLLSEWRDGADFSFLRVESAILPDFDPSAAVVEAQVMPAAAVSAPSGLASGHFAAPDLWDTLVKDFSTDPQAMGGGALPPADVQPFSWLDEGSAASAPAVEPFSLDAFMEPKRGEPSDIAMSFMQSKRVPATDQLSLEKEIAAFEAPVAPFVPEVAQVPPPAAVPPPAPVLAAAPRPEPTRLAAAPPPAHDPFVTADGRVDLTVGWDDLDRQLREATPSFDNAAEMDALAASLGVAGIAPFEVDDSSFDESAWAPFTADELGEPNAAPPAAASVPAAAAVPMEPSPVAFVPEPFVSPAEVYAAQEALQAPAFVEEEAYDLGWDLDEELVSAIPPPQASGYTEMLRHVDVELPQEISTGGEVDPFANPDSSGEPLAFEELMAVTSRDGTSPLGASAAVDEPAADPEYGELSSMDELAAMFGVVGEEGRLPLDQSPQGLEALLWDDAPANDRGEPFWAQPPGAEAAAAFEAEPAPALDWSLPVEEPVLGELEDIGFDAALAGLGDLQPFSLGDEAEFAAGVGEGGIDFSDINEAPFDPSAISRVVSSPPLAPFQAVDNSDWVLDAEVVDLQASGKGPANPAWAEVALGEVAEPEPAVAPEPPVVAAAAVAKRDVSGLGVMPGGVAWPAYVNHTSELIDRSLSGGNLFARLREAKRAASAAGLLHVDRSVRQLRPEAVATAPREDRVHVFSVPAKPVSNALNGAARQSTMTEAERIDLMAMRVRLIEDASSAGEVAQQLERTVQHGLSDPLALRVLGEAYLKLGRTEQAAAQFRQAMLTRHRAR